MLNPTLLQPGDVLIYGSGERFQLPYADQELIPILQMHTVVAVERDGVVVQGEMPKRDMEVGWVEPVSKDWRVLSHVPKQESPVADEAMPPIYNNHKTKDPNAHPSHFRNLRLL